MAQYKCLQCHCEFKDKCGPVSCPVCTHPYIKWLNYEEMRKTNFKPESVFIIAINSESFLASLTPSLITVFMLTPYLMYVILKPILKIINRQ